MNGGGWRGAKGGKAARRGQAMIDEAAPAGATAAEEGDDAMPSGLAERRRRRLATEEGMGRPSGTARVSK